MHLHFDGEATIGFLRSRARWIGIRGPVGGGKTTTVLAKLRMLMDAQAPSPLDGRVRLHITVVRNTFAQLKDATIPSWHEVFPESLGKFTWDPPTHIVPIYRNGKDVGEAKVRFLPLDNKSTEGLLRGLQTTIVWLNEADQIDEKYLDMLDQRVGRYPPMIHGGPTWKGILMDTNSPAPSHWWYRLDKENTPPGYSFFSQPPAILISKDVPPDKPFPVNPKAENLKYLVKDYYFDMQYGTGGRKPLWWLKRYLGNEYCDADGATTVYGENYRPDLHDAEELTPLPMSPLTIGVDFGLTPAAAILQASPSGGVMCLDEITTRDGESMGARRLGQIIKARLAQPDLAGLAAEIWADPAGWQKSQADETQPATVLAAATGLRVRPAPTNLFSARREVVELLLSQLIEGRPRFKLSKKCQKLRLGFVSEYKFDTSDEGISSDSPIKNSASHIHDALQYAVLGLGIGAELSGRRRRGQAPAQRQQRVEIYHPG